MYEINVKTNSIYYQLGQLCMFIMNNTNHPHFRKYFFAKSKKQNKTTGKETYYLPLTLINSVLLFTSSVKYD